MLYSKWQFCRSDRFKWKNWRPGENYGWPDSQGDTVLEGTQAPILHSTADVTWAPGGLAYLDGSLFMTGLRGETLYKVDLEDNENLNSLEDKIHALEYEYYPKVIERIIG